MITETYYRYVIGDVAFSTRDEAEEWVEAGNIGGGVYSIDHEVWCDTHDWQREWWSTVNREYVCWECSTREREAQDCYDEERAAMQRKLAA